ncbi:MAG: VOC family protein [Acidimicrobiia bacterium]|nr:VOC family protein [Acidimicrobiia bacterium]MBT8216006.1 VOC family protein [Acidimicrobiia bacterium]NNF10751.1 VOC family protein [Acidimicrobiia bacterium]NNL69220.1 VOC family protein [Acidimicrobiia bacterium]
MRVDDQITFIYVSDLEQAARFYGNVIGLEQVLDQGGCLIFRVTPTSFLGACTLRPEQVGVAGALVTFVTEDVDIWYQRLVEDGATILTEPAHNETFKIYNFFAEDPDGNRFEVQRFDDPTWKVADA